MVAAANLVVLLWWATPRARRCLLVVLMGGQSLTATELAYCADISRSTASGHLSKLVASRLLVVTRERRFSYYRITSPLVARMLENIKLVLRNHASEIAAIDFFIVPTIGFDLLYAFVIFRIDRRDLIWVNVTKIPTAE